ncbi:hypothetical protein [Streptomyces sp. PTY087I2]|uniref:hypothetical protein n=1 Tax=Streptomyces sp. PTY087I2 TaxID=1819298 RepID=UPI0008275451|nr:hypothetical protein [Streptomyces sp. PTY087I2]OCC09461.1 hypothetical protein A3Q37_04816 [Streptomyces sp. PTY087I2]
MGGRRPVVLLAAWVVIAAGGWGATHWLGEPAATSGPAPRPAQERGAETASPDPCDAPDGSARTTPTGPPGGSEAPDTSFRQNPDGTWSAAELRAYVCTG